MAVFVGANFVASGVPDLAAVVPGPEILADSLDGGVQQHGVSANRLGVGVFTGGALADRLVRPGPRDE